MSGEVAVHLGPPVLDKVERSWSCWRHPNASGVGLKVAGAMETVEPHKAQSDFLERGCGRVRGSGFLDDECRLQVRTTGSECPSNI